MGGARKELGPYYIRANWEIATVGGCMRGLLLALLTSRNAITLFVLLSRDTAESRGIGRGTR